MMLNHHHFDVITSKPQQVCYGGGLGVLLLDDVYPGFPGDVRNHSSFPYPVQYEIVEGVDIKALAYSSDRDTCYPAILAAAQRLRRFGVGAVVGECGHFSYFQKRLAADMDIPVYISSMLQVAWAQSLIGPERLVGLLVSHTDAVTPEHLMAVGISPNSNIVIRGARNDGKCPAFDRLWVKTKRANPVCVSRSEAAEQFLAVATEFVEDNPGMGALVLECTGFPPFARQVQDAVGLPVFSFATLMDFAFSSIVHREFQGHV
ncbi:MAG: aspartate/glutamate racemase family protein [Pseudomonadota bacterium]